MHVVFKSTGLSLVAAMLAGLALPAQANPYTPRQYYSSWNYHSSNKYHYRNYYYKPSSEYSGYKHHYAIYYPSRPKYVYFYNQYERKYWGRCPTSNYEGYTPGVGQYSLLKAEDRRGSIEEIPEQKFPPPAALPPIPESKDGATLELPPDDLPPEGSGLPVK